MKNTILSVITALLLMTFATSSAFAGGDDDSGSTMTGNDIMPMFVDGARTRALIDIHGGAGTAGQGNGDNAYSNGSSLTDFTVDTRVTNCQEDGCPGFGASISGLLGTQHETVAESDGHGLVNADTATTDAGALDAFAQVQRGSVVDGGNDAVPVFDQFSLVGVRSEFTSGIRTAGSADGDQAYTGGQSYGENLFEVGLDSCEGGCPGLRSVFSGRLGAQQQSSATDQGEGSASSSTATQADGFLHFESLIRRGSNVGASD